MKAAIQKWGNILAYNPDAGRVCLCKKRFAQDRRLKAYLTVKQVILEILTSIGYVQNKGGIHMSKRMLNTIEVTVFVITAIIAITEIMRTIVIHKTTLTSTPLRSVIALIVFFWLAALVIEGILYVIALKLFVKG